MKIIHIILICFIILITILALRTIYLREDCCICGYVPTANYIDIILNPQSVDCCACPPDPDSELCYHNPEDKLCKGVE